MTTKEKSPDISRVLKLKARIESDANLLGFVGSVPKGRDFQELVNYFKCLMPASVSRSVLEDSLFSLSGQSISQELLAETAWRLAGNLPRLRQGYAVLPWTHQARREWLPVHLTHAAKEFSSRGRPLVRYRAVVLAGSPTACKVDKVWPQRYLPIIARYIGFTRTAGAHPFQHYLQLVGLRMRVLFDPEHQSSTPMFEQVDEKQPGNVLAWNEMIMGWRQRRTWVCPEKFVLPEHPCHLCHIGLDRCKAAVHPQTYVMRECLRCRKQALHDPAGHGKHCLDCEFKKVLAESQGVEE